MPSFLILAQALSGGVEFQAGTRPRADRALFVTPSRSSTPAFESQDAAESGVLRTIGN